MPRHSSVLAAFAGTFLAAACATTPRVAPSPNPEPSRPVAAELPPTPPPAAPAPAEAASIPAVLGRLTFAAVGDVLPHVSVKQSAAAADLRERGRSLNHGGYDALFEAVAADLSDADFTFANLETPIAPKGDAGSKEYVFNAPPDLLEALKAAGVDLVSFANNHVFDQGGPGFAESLRELERSRLVFAGAGRSRDEALAGARLEKNGIRVAFLAGAQFFNRKDLDGGPWNDPYALKVHDAALMEGAVRQARLGADFVLVSMHWGDEYEPAPKADEVELAHRLFEAGADVILGHHPHVLQKIELYKAQDGRPCAVIYSLGNFISNQSRQYADGVSPEKVGETRDGAIFRFEVVKRDHGSGVIRAELGPVSFVPLWTDNDFLGRRPGKPPVIREVVVGRALEKSRTELDALRAALRQAKKLTKEQAATVVGLQKRVTLLERRRKAIAARLGEEFLRAPAAERPSVAPPADAGR